MPGSGEISGDTMDGEEYFEVAAHLAQEGTKEGYFRSSVSRAYYGLFLCLRDRISYVNWPKEAKAHKLMEECIRQAKVDMDSESKCSHVASALRDLRKERNKADYGSNNGYTQKSAELMLHKATLALEKFQRVIPAQLKRGIHTHLIDTNQTYFYKG